MPTCGSYMWYVYTWVQRPLQMLAMVIYLPWLSLRFAHNFINADKILLRTIRKLPSAIVKNGHSFRIDRCKISIHAVQSVHRCIRPIYLQMIISIILMVSGAIVFGYMISSVTAALANADAGRARFQEKLNGITLLMAVCACLLFQLIILYPIS